MSKMNLNSKQATFAIPVFCKDQAADIHNIEAAANKALQNIYSLYDEIMTPKVNFDADREPSVSDYSSDSTAVSIGDKNGSHSYPGDPKLFQEELCSKCQKLVSLCSACRKHDSSIVLQNHHHPQTINKKFLPERINSYPQVKPFRRHSYHPVQKDSHHHEQHALRNTSQERRESHHQGECVQTIPHYPEEIERQRKLSHSNSTKKEQDDSHHQGECIQTVPHYPEEVRRNSHQVLENSHYPEEFQRQRKLSQSNSIKKGQNMKNQQQRRNSYYSESNSECNEYSNYTFKRLKESNIQFSITIPKPFSLTAENVKRQQAKEEKISKMREEINSQIEKELNVKFSPKPVPKHVNLPIYGEMVKMNEKRKKERKDKCIEILSQKTKPFNLSTGTRSCISKSVSDLSQDDAKAFKAKPVPKNILSENISQKIKNKEEIRKLLIAQRAEEMLRKSSLPFSHKPINRSLSLFNISDSPNKSNVNVTKEKIEAITNRLYSIKCQETIENWNEKVLQNDSQNTNYHKKSNKDKNFHKSTFPFQNFPVRMTTATFLREKQIRADIEMRKRREETNESIKEEFIRRQKEILKNIWPRLKSAEQIYDIGKEIEEKVKSYRQSQKNREQEYEKELEDMMRRVSKQFLLIERQSKELKEKKEASVAEVSSTKDEIDSSENVESSAADSPTPSVSEKSDST